MFTASYYFLGVAVSICATLFFLTSGKRAGKKVEVDLDTLHTATICLPRGRQMTSEDVSAAYKDLPLEEKAKFNDSRSSWMRWYEQSKKKALMKQKAMYSWARTMSLCSVLCLIGVLLEAQFNQPITLHAVLTGFRRPNPPASHVETPQPRQSQNQPALSNASTGQI
jgi:hypothetical protein